MNLTDEEYAIIGHVVVDPRSWVAHALSIEKLGEGAVQAKIDKYRGAYLAEKDKPGYKTRAQLQTEQNAAEETVRLENIKSSKIQRKAEDAALEKKIDDAIKKALLTR